MKEIKILHLFPRLMSLYGEYGNVAVLKAALEKLGCSVTVAEFEQGTPDFAGYDLIYMGSGTEDNLMVALERLAPYGEAVKSSIAAAHWLATGNAMALFGKTITRGENKSDALGVFEYDTLVEDGKRFLGDVLTQERTLGFINTSCVYTGIREPLHQLCLNPKLGNDKKLAAEGIRVGKFTGTQLIGPYLVKNPHCLGIVVEQLTGADHTPGGYGVQAYEVAYKELSTRLD